MPEVTQLYCVGDFVKWLKNGEFGTVTYIWLNKIVVEVSFFNGSVIPVTIDELVMA